MSHNDFCRTRSGTQPTSPCERPLLTPLPPEEAPHARRDVPVTVRRPTKSKRALYTITDPYLAFWHRFVSPLIQTGVPDTAPPEAVWEGRIRPRLDDYMGPVFEEVCREAIRVRPDLLPIRPFRVGSWWSSDSRDEVDIVVLSQEDEVLIGECKWGAVGADDLRTLRRRADLVSAELKDVSRIHLALFTGSGIADDAVRAEADEGGVVLFTAEELFP